MPCDNGLGDFVKNIIKKIVKTVGVRFFSPVLKKIARQKELIHLTAQETLKTRAMVKQLNGEPINVLFVCHEPSLWNMFESVYTAMDEDTVFRPTVVVLPYKHGSLPSGQFKDGGMAEFLDERRIPFIQGYDPEKNKWVNPASMSPDYVFFQTPYVVFPPTWSVERVSLIARVCYIPYGTNLFRGDVDDVAHPPSFLQFVTLVFKESEFAKSQFVQKFCNADWFDEGAILISGQPKLDGLLGGRELSGKVWKRDLSEDIMRILWTPRWNTGEGNCHFFDYKDFFIDFSREHQGIDFAFRPHPLCFQNFINTGEITETEIIQMEAEYEQSANMVIDKAGGYQDTFLTSDILVSDVSSMLLEYLATGKPIIYTHRIDVFNELGEALAKGVYWVRTQAELSDTLKMLLTGRDPLRETRMDLMNSILLLPDVGAGVVIGAHLKKDFSN